MAGLFPDATHEQLQNFIGGSPPQIFVKADNNFIKTAGSQPADFFNVFIPPVSHPGHNSNSWSFLYIPQVFTKRLERGRIMGIIYKQLTASNLEKIHPARCKLSRGDKTKQAFPDICGINSGYPSR